MGALLMGALLMGALLMGALLMGALLMGALLMGALLLGFSSPLNSSLRTTHERRRVNFEVVEHDARGVATRSSRHRTAGMRRRSRQIETGNVSAVLGPARNHRTVIAHEFAAVTRTADVGDVVLGK